MDCSTDNSRTIIDEYRNNPKINTIIYNEKNSDSIFKQWEKGISWCRGDLVWIAKSDDAASPFFLEKLVPLILNHNAIMAFADSMTISENGAEIPGWETLINVKRKNNYVVLDGTQYVRKAMLFGNRVTNASAVVFNKKKAL
jgi:glycosyltransferase involved in cell wall biosynthesis